MAPSQSHSNPRIEEPRAVFAVEVVRVFGINKEAAVDSWVLLFHANDIGFFSFNSESVEKVTDGPFTQRVRAEAYLPRLIAVVETGLAETDPARTGHLG